MQNNKTASGIVIKTVAITLAAIIAAVGLVFAIAISVRPLYAYRIYEYLGNERGQYVYAVKIYDQARKDGAAEDVAISALGRVIEDGLAYRLDGGEAQGLADYVSAMLAREDVAAYARTVDERNKLALSPLYHVFSTGYEGILAGEYVALCYGNNTEEVLQFALRRWNAFAESTKGALSDVRADSALDTFIACFARQPEGGLVQTLELEFNSFTATFDPSAELAQRIEAVGSENSDELFGALHAAKSITKLAEAYELIGYESKALTTFWETQFARLLTAYVAVA